MYYSRVQLLDREVIVQETDLCVMTLNKRIFVSSTPGFIRQTSIERAFRLQYIYRVVICNKYSTEDASLSIR